MYFNGDTMGKKILPSNSINYLDVPNRKRYVGRSSEQFGSWIHGYDFNTNYQGSNGFIDDLRIYDRCLSQGEIISIYDYKFPNLGCGKYFVES